MKKMKILIVESTDAHTPYIETLMNLFNENENIIPYAFFNKKHENILKDDYSEFYKNNKNKFIIDKIWGNEINEYFFKKFFYRIIQIFQISKIIKEKKIDHITVNTIQTKKNIFLVLYLLFSNKKISLTIHDTQFDNKKIFDKVFTMLQKMIIKKSKFLFFFANYLKENKIFEDKKKIHINYIHNFKKPIKKYKRKTVVIMNSPDQNKGDIEGLLKEIVKIKEIDVIIPLKVRNNETKKIIQNYSKLKKIKYFEKYVPEKNYLNYLKKAHIAIIPKLFDKNSGYRKISAGFSCAEGYGLPIIIHKSYLKNKKNKMRNIYEFNKNEEIPKIIKIVKIPKNTEHLEYDLIKKINSFFNNINCN
jgi:hypothetical protein